MDEPKRYNPANTLTPADILPTMKVRFLATGHEGLINTRDFNADEHESLEPKAKKSASAPAPSKEKDEGDETINPTKFDAKVERPKLEALTKAALLDLARERGVEVDPKATKDVIVDELVDAKVAV